jgi:cell shape-determining protein MreC
VAMSHRVLSQRRVLIVLAVLLLVSSFLPSGLSHELWSRPRHLKDLLLTPIADPLHALSLAIRRPASSTPPMANVEAEEIARSRNYLRRLEAELKEAHDKLAQFERISALARAGQVNLRGLDLVSARVTGWEGSPIEPLLMINRGRTSRLVPNLAVSDGVNLVGYVQDVGAMTSSVVLLPSSRVPLEVRIVPPTLESPTRELPGYLQYDPRRRTFYLVCSKQADVRTGDLAHLTGGGWPDEAKGLVVGQVVGVEPYADPHFNCVLVQPMVDMRYLQRVIVLVPVEEAVPSGRAAASS